MKTIATKSWIAATAVIMFSSLVLSACGGNNANPSQNPAPSADTGTKSGTSSPANKDLNLFVDMNWWPFKDWSGKIPEQIAKDTGLNIHVTVAADNKQLPLMIASGDMPDIIYTYDHITDMSNSKVSIPWSDLIPKYAPDFKPDPAAIKVNTASDGKYYTIRNGFMTRDQFQGNKYALVRGGGMVVREDIMKELGNPPLGNLDDFQTILGMVKQKYPDMIPLVMTPLQTDAYFRIQFGLPRFGFTTVNDQVKYYISDPVQLDYYKYMNELYRKGYIQAENYTWKDTNQASTLSLNGKAFAQEFDVATSEQLNAQLERDGKPFRYMQVTKLLGKNPALINNNPGFAGLFVPTKSKNQEAAMKFIQYMASDKGQKLASWGVEGEDYKMSPDGGYPIFNYNTSDAEIQKKLGIVMWGILADTGITEAVARYQPGKPGTEAMVNLRPAYKSDAMLGMLIPDSGSDQQVIQSNLDTMIKTNETKIILAKTPEEAVQAYNDMMAQADKIGIKKFEDWANQKYIGIKAAK